MLLELSAHLVTAAQDSPPVQRKISKIPVVAVGDASKAKGKCVER